MTMRTPLVLLTALTVALAGGLVLAQRDLSQVQVKATKVAGSVHMLEGAGGNIGVSAGPDGLLIVDDQFAPLAEKIRAALTAINPGKLKFVLNTHFHGDHTGGNPIFGREAPIVAQTNVRKRLTAQNIPHEGLPVLTFDQSVSIHFNGEEIKVIHLPNGHTDGDSIIYFTGSKVLHLGDDFFAGAFPFVDLNSGGSVQGLTRNIETVIATAPADVKIIPGHGPLSTLEDLRRFHRMLLETTAIVRRQIDEKKTLEQIKAQGLPEAWRSWGTGFIKTDAWIETLYRSLTQPARTARGPATRHH
jgi:cyclase